ncbi:hypothetical protein H5410_044397 [Solanum commersonii]|uniref:Uncharacterized protein n=1 Tax=Solanum commersonii TaxID=4109 RepID=A0A9J5X6X5_SOLCO|nr:hypothetical protein H5410_044397 [Solanum commersonii]
MRELSMLVRCNSSYAIAIVYDFFICRRDGPSLVVASGRDTISISSSIKQLAPEYVFTVQDALPCFIMDSETVTIVPICPILGGQSYLVPVAGGRWQVSREISQDSVVLCFQIQHPRSRLNRFDLVITPRHDYYPLTPEGQKQIPWLLRRWITPRTSPERHVILTVGALHQADSNALKDAAYTWHDELATLLRPLLVVNVGGPTDQLSYDDLFGEGHCRYGTDLALELTDLLLNIVPTCGSIRVSFSRRTPCKVSDIIWEEIGNHPKVHIWNGEGSTDAMFVFLSLAEENCLFNEKINE